MKRQPKTKALVDPNQWRESKEALVELKKRAKDGDRSVLPAIREYMSEHPEVWQQTSLLELTNEELMLKTFGDCLLTQETIRRQVDAEATGVAGPNPTPLESMLARRVALCKMHVEVAEYLCWNDQKNGAKLHMIEHHQKRLDKAQNMLLKATRTLAQVRRLRLPAIQVNIGDQQVNCMEMGAPGLTNRRPQQVTTENITNDTAA